MSKLQVRKLQRIVLEQRQQERQQRRQGGAANKGAAGSRSFRPIRTPLSSSAGQQQQEHRHGNNATTIDLEAEEDAAIAAVIAASLRVVEESPLDLGMHRDPSAEVNHEPSCVSPLPTSTASSNPLK
jgi:hypothetical protein